MKRPKKSKAEIEADIQRANDIRKVQHNVETLLSPIFLTHNLTIYQAGQVLEVLKQVSLGKMNASWKDRPFQELGLMEELASDQDAADRALYEQLIESLKELSVADTMKMLDTFSRVIEMYGHRQVMLTPYEKLPLQDIFKQ